MFCDLGLSMYFRIDIILTPAPKREDLWATRVQLEKGARVSGNLELHSTPSSRWWKSSLHFPSKAGHDNDIGHTIQLAQQHLGSPALAHQGQVYILGDVQTAAT
mmetsp:Transcript_5948/g.17171  ORF Transcript_5948/g.17171 Transcript_5948/m.17171 type:complete len:104 (+) Transcript_5948:57-368(+)